MKVKKAVFPVAGFGTRFLPATKAIGLMKAYEDFYENHYLTKY